MKCGRCGREVQQDGSGNWYSSHMVNDSVTGHLTATDQVLTCDDGFPHGPIVALPVDNP